MPVAPIPDGYHSLTPYLNVNDAAKLIDFMKQAFGAEELLRMPGPGGAVQHAELRVGDSILMVSDALRDPPMPSTLFLYVPDTDATYRRALAAGAASVAEPVDKFWGDRFARVRDPAGNLWSLATHREDVAPEELARRAAAPASFGLRLERSFAAPRAQVFHAFTEPALRSQWLRPGDDWTVPVTELDPRVGGRYRDVFRSPDGTEFTETGEFREVKPAERLVYTSRFEGGGVLEPDMLVTLEFRDGGAGKSRLVVEQSGYRSRKNRDEQEQGWPAFLDQLGKLLARR
jgi:PhnB protein